MQNNLLSKEEKFNEGVKAGKTLLPFLRTDVPFSAVYQLGDMVAGWCGFPENSSFMQGFTQVFMDYKEANNRALVQAPFVEQKEG